MESNPDVYENDKTTNCSIEDRAIDLCFYLEKSGFNLYDGGCITDNYLVDVIGDDLSVNGAYNVITHAIQEGWLIELHNNYSLIVENKAWADISSQRIVTLNPFYSQGIPIELLDATYVNSNSKTPRERIKFLQDDITTYDAYITQLKQELIDREKEFAENYPNFYENDPEDSNYYDETPSEAHMAYNEIINLPIQIQKSEEKRDCFNSYGSGLKSFLELNPDDFSDNLFYVGKSQTDLNLESTSDSKKKIFSANE